jgi:exopolyphosphatase / guanosine-5'-triphosphate,3'-diphosphate pyrophosphatase
LKVSVIDLGFNSTKLVNYIVGSDNSFRIEGEHSIKARLGEGLSEKGLLSNQSIIRVIEVLKLFREIINIKSIKHVLPIATSAVREAHNKQDFLRMVYELTGLQFRVLSAEEEALYSYLGAVKAICQPDTLFFDLGGGSLEIVSAKNYKIKKIMSLPLGALRLSEKFSRRGCRLTKKDMVGLEKEILITLPDPDDLALGNNTKVVGVGGSLRAIARYDQKIKRYPLNILHNYVLDYNSIQSMRKKFSKMNSRDIADIDAIGSNRASSITAASIVINTMIQKLEIHKVVVSTHGLREGCLVEYLNKPKMMQSVRLAAKNIQTHLREKCEPDLLPNPTSKFAQVLLSLGMMKKEEYEIFIHAKKETSKRYSDFWQADVILSLVMNDFFPRLSQEAQLILALSLIFRKKPKAAEKLSGLYDTLLHRQDRKSIQKIAVCVDLTEIFERYASHVDLTKEGTGRLIMKIVAKTNYVPERIVSDTIKIFESVFDVGLTYIICRPRKQTNQLSKLLAHDRLR